MRVFSSGFRDAFATAGVVILALFSAVGGVAVIVAYIAVIGGAIGLGLGAIAGAAVLAFRALTGL